jgi:PAS domain S-box-containing protein
VDAQPQVEALRVHGRLIMERARRLDDLLRDATGAALAREIASLDEAHAEWRRLRAVELRRDWNLIYALALTLFVYAGFMLWRLRVATRKLADSEEQYRHILAYAPDAIVSVNQAQQIVGFNAAAEATFGYRADEAIGQPLDLLLPDRCRASHGTHVRGFAKEAGSARRMTNPSGGELEARRKDGSLFAAEIGISKCTTNSGLTFTATVRDITERKRAEAEIRQLNAELEVRVLKRTAELSEANEKLTQTVETLRETQDQLVQSEKMAALGSLVAGISHEVNTPIGIAVTSASSLHERLNALRASFEEGAMKRSMLEDFIAYADQAADILSRNLRRASDLIGSFKRVAVDQSSDHWENIALHEYVDEVLVSLRPKLKHTAVHVTNAVPDDLTIYTNPGAIYQVLSNLILNSITHAFDGGQRGSVLIEASQVGSFLHLSYRDDGKGIPAEHLPRVFDPFFTTRRGAGGSGLGLHIVYNLVTGTLRGRIDVSSEAGKGVQFRIRLPLNEERAPA